MSFFTRLLLIFFFLVLSFNLFANPFTGNKNSPHPVRQSQPSDNIKGTQRFLHQQLGEYIREWKENSSLKDFLLILLFSFLYGIIHAIGPGHRKTVIFTFYLTRHSHVLEPFLTAFVLAFSHAGIALIIALIFRGMAGAISVNSNNTSIYLEGGSFILLIILSLFSIIHVVFDHTMKKGHNNNSKYEKIKLGTLLISGLYPCPAALLVIVLTFALNIVGTGIAAIFAMSLGMCLPITIAGYIAWLGRVGLFNRLSNKKATAFIGTMLELSAYVFLFFFSLHTAMPFIISLINRLFQ